VRRGALQAISLLAGQLGGQRLREADPELIAAVIESSQSQSDDPQESTPRGQLRAIAAYTLGLLGGSEATQRLQEMRDDPFPDARYNAATGLARLGDSQAISGLVEMLDPENRASEPFEKETSDDPGSRRLDPEQREANYQSRLTWKRDLVLRNGLQATAMLIEKNPVVRDHPELKAAIERLQRVREELDAAVLTELKVVEQLMG
jgi:HEAT repeat protein